MKYDSSKKFPKSHWRYIMLWQKERKSIATTCTIARQDQTLFVRCVHRIFSYRYNVFPRSKQMELNDANPIELVSNYAGACGQPGPTITDLIQLTNPDRTLIHGPNLFALKYRILPCTMHENSSSHGSGYDDIYSMNTVGAFAALSRGRRLGGKRKEAGVIHATRWVFL